MSDLDGKTVTWRGDQTWRGVVESDSYIPGTVRVRWLEPHNFVSPSMEKDLMVVDE
jgi:hypothetical protein